MEVAEITQSACVKWEEKDQKFLNVPDIKWGSGGNTRKVSKETGQLSPERWDSGLREAEGSRFQKEEWISNSEMAAKYGWQGNLWGPCWEWSQWSCRKEDRLYWVGEWEESEKCVHVQTEHRPVFQDL